jgi:hypothetical protein
MPLANDLLTISALLAKLQTHLQAKLIEGDRPSSEMGW